MHICSQKTCDDGAETAGSRGRNGDGCFLSSHLRGGVARRGRTDSQSKETTVDPSLPWRKSLNADTSWIALRSRVARVGLQSVQRLRGQ
jgi:hypothetical protein